jgi:undecaprenyl-diphosphatase
MQELLASNWQIFDSINDHAGQNAPLDRFMVFSANDLIFGIAVILLLWWLVFVSWSPVRGWLSGLSAFERRLGLRTLVMTVVAVVLAYAANLTIERFVFEPRPFISHPTDDILLVSHPADASFPSDHAAVAFAVTLMLLLYVGLLVRYQLRDRHTARKSLAEWRATATHVFRDRYALVGVFAVVTLLAALTIGFARIFVGVHYPLDILGGAGTGSLSACFSTWLGGRLKQPIDRLLALLARVKLA